MHFVGRVARAGWFALATFAVGACSPALDWREVHLDKVTAVLPCKPDSATRQVMLGSTQYSMEMQGCEAQGALYALSRIRLGQNEDANVVQVAWQQAAQATLHTNTAHPIDMPGTTTAGRTLWASEGVNSQGDPTQARWLWLKGERELYHLAVYAPEITPDLVDNWWLGIRLP